LLLTEEFLTDVILGNGEHAKDAKKELARLKSFNEKPNQP